MSSRSSSWRLAALLAAGGFLAILARLVLPLLEPADPAQALPVPAGDQEIAWIHAATNAPSWERFVAGATHLAASRPELGLTVDARRAFPPATSTTPELVLGRAGARPRLRIRWYRLTAERGTSGWVRALLERPTPPLAIIGGGSSDRARDLALELRGHDRRQPDLPVLILTTATADQVWLEAEGEPLSLVEVYPGRTFRFCFTNSQMAEAVADFVQRRPDLYRSAAGSAVVALQWLDDPYSIDLAQQFRYFLRNAATRLSGLHIEHSIGDYSEANPPEQRAASMLAAEMTVQKDGGWLLVLPTVDKPARRVLRALARAAPLELRRVAALTGDSINFNNVYRDRDLAWNLPDLPAALVFFCHEHPLNPAAAPADSSLAVATAFLAASPGSARTLPPAPVLVDHGGSSAADDLALNARILEAVVDAAYQTDGAGNLGLIAEAAELAAGLRALRRNGSEPFFDAAGNRLGRSGEHVVCLRPVVRGDRVLPAGVLEIWSRTGLETKTARAWRHAGSMLLSYGQGEGIAWRAGRGESMPGD